MFCKKKLSIIIVFIYLIVFMLPQNVNAETVDLNYVDLNNWSEDFPTNKSNGSWNIEDGGRSLKQTVNGQPTGYLSPDEDFNEVIMGTIEVQTTSDDDFIGFILGYQEPSLNSTIGLYDYDFILFDWKQSSQTVGNNSVAIEGYTLKRINGTADFSGTEVIEPTFWENQDDSSDTTMKILAKNNNYNGWNDNQRYLFKILYTNNQIKVKVDDQVIFDVSGSFNSGRYGFYNYSQEAVKYGKVQSAPGSSTPADPIAEPDEYVIYKGESNSIQTDGLSGILFNDYDPNLDDYSIVLSDSTTKGNLNLDTNDGSFTYIPNFGEVGTDSFSYYLEETSGSTSEEVTVTINIIEGTNEPPTDISISNSVVSNNASNGSAAGYLTTTDANASDVHDYLLINNAGGTFGIRDNEIFINDNSSFEPGKEYSIEVRSIDAGDLSYQETMTIEVDYVKPTVITSSYSNLSSIQTTLSGNVIDDGGDTITSRGMAWSEQTNPTTDDSIKTVSGSLGEFDVDLSNLKPNTTYYYRTFATNSKGTSYGSTESFKTDKEILTLNGSFTANNKTYDSNTSAEVLENNLTLEGMLTGFEDVSLDNVSLNFTSEDVGTDTLVNIDSAILTGNDANYYELSLVGAPTTTANITKRDLILDNFQVNNKAYDGNVSANGGFDDNRVSGDDLFFTFDVSFSNKNVSNDKEVSFSSIAIDGGSDELNYNLVTTTGSALANITKRTLTLSNFEAISKVYDGNTNAQISFDDNRIGSDDLSFNYQVEFSDKNVGNNKEVTINNISILGGIDAGNYQLSTLNGQATADITKRTLKITNINADDKIYDKTTEVYGAEFIDDRLSGDDLNYDFEANFASIDVGTDIVVTFSAISLNGGEDIGNYQLDLASTTGVSSADINPRPINFSNFYADDKTYDGNIDVWGASMTSDILSGDKVGYSYEAHYANKDVGIDKKVYFSNIAIIDGSDASNYYIPNQNSEDNTALSTINPLEISVEGAIAANKEYDGTTQTVINNASLNGVLDGDEVLIGSNVADFVNKNVGLGIEVIANLALGGADSNNYIVAQPTNLLADITKADLNVVNSVALDKTYDQTSEAAITTATLDGIFGSDEVILNNHTSGVFTQVDVGQDINVTTSMTISGSDSDNYNLIQPDYLKADIIPKELIVAGANGINKEYDGKVDAEIENGTLEGILGLDEVTIDKRLGQFVSPNANSNVEIEALITITGSDVNNYYLKQPVGLSADITKKDLSIKADDKAKVYDGKSFSGDYSVNYEGFISQEDESVLNGSLSYSGNSQTAIDSGLYNITPSGLSSNNYSVTYEDGVLTITPRLLTINNFVVVDKIYDATTSVATVSIEDDRLNGDELSYTYSASFDDKNVGNKLISIKNIAIASGDDKDNYTLTQTEGFTNANILAKPLNVEGSIDVLDKVYDGTNLANIDSSALSLDGIIGNEVVEISSLKTSFEEALVDNFKKVSLVEVNLSGEDSSNYYTNLENSPEDLANITPKELTITVEDEEKIYGQEDPEYNVSYTGFIDGKDKNILNGELDISRELGEEVGMYLISAQGLTNNNYDISYASGELDITPKDLLVTVNDEAKIYGEEDPEYSVIYNEFIEGENEDDLVGRLVFERESNENVGSYQVSASGLVSDNYNITYLNGSLGITKRDLSITAIASDILYGDQSPSVDLEYNGFIFEEDESVLDNTSFVLGTTYTQGDNVGSYQTTIELGEASDNNYTFGPLNSSDFDIQKKDLEISVPDYYKYINHSDPEFEIEVTGLIPQDTVANLSGDLLIEREEGEVSGTYIITASGLSSDNYNISFVDGNLIIRRPPSKKEKSKIIVKTDNNLQPTITNEVEDENGKRLDIIVENEYDNNSEVILNGQMVKEMEEEDTVINVKSLDTEYSIPAKEITIESIAKELNVPDDDLEEIEVEIVSGNVSDEDNTKFVSDSENKGYQIVTKAVDFKVKAKAIGSDGRQREVEVKKFSSYVKRSIEIPEGIDPTQITTGVILNPDGTTSHVPTKIIEKDGKYYAEINSLTNSIYSVIWNPINVESVANHWAKTPVNDLASRLVISDYENFDPNKNITRAEFADYITKAIGIYRTDIETTDIFSDVNENSDFSKAITIASEYKIISGYPDNTFKLDKEITRQEAMAMYANAMDLVSLNDIDVNRISTYEDNMEVSTWAYESVKKAIGARVFNGRTSTLISPNDTLTCAEAATAVWNLLRESNLINK